MVARCEKKCFSDGSCASVCTYETLVNLPHWHIEHELIYVDSGCAEVMINNAVYVLEANMCAFAAGEEIHYIKSESKSVVTVMKIIPDAVRSIVGNKKLLSPIIENNYHIREIMSEICSELGEKRKYAKIIAECDVTKLFAQIFRNEGTAQKNDDISDTRYKELLEIISQKYAHITFDEAAEIMCLSKPYFSKFFHRVTGMTFTAYLNIVRVSAAAEIILQHNMPMTEVAMRCGFGTIRSFNRVFRELTGYSPTSVPEDFTVIAKSGGENGFDPTLSCSVLIGASYK